MPSIEIATRAAENFTRLYYTTYDSPTRVDDLPNYYRANSALTWNGRPFEGVEGVRELVSGIPATKHEVQSFDCHPIPGGPRTLCDPPHTTDALAPATRQPAAFPARHRVGDCHPRQGSRREPPEHAPQGRRRPPTCVLADLRARSGPERAPHEVRGGREVLHHGGRIALRRIGSRRAYCTRSSM